MRIHSYWANWKKTPPKEPSGTDIKTYSTENILKNKKKIQPEIPETNRRGIFITSYFKEEMLHWYLALYTFDKKKQNIK